MLESKDSNNINKTTLLVIGIATIVVALIGATVAFFTANPVQNNSVTNTITSTTANYGTTTVSYDGTNGTISMGIVDLPESTKGTNVSRLMKFRVATTANVSQRITISWAGTGKVTNTFCQYLGNTNGLCYATSSLATAGGNSAPVDVRNEIQYELYECTYEGYTNISTATHDNCTLISVANSPAPITNSNALLHTSAYRTIPASGTNYYALVLTILNKNSEQNYNEGKSFSAQLSVGALNN